MTTRHGDFFTLTPSHPWSSAAVVAARDSNCPFRRAISNCPFRRAIQTAPHLFFCSALRRGKTKHGNEAGVRHAAREGVKPHRPAAIIYRGDHLPCEACLPPGSSVWREPGGRRLCLCGDLWARGSFFVTHAHVVVAPFAGTHEKKKCRPDSDVSGGASTLEDVSDVSDARGRARACKPACVRTLGARAPRPQFA